MSVHGVEMSHLNALAVHRLALAMEEFPHLPGPSRAQECDKARAVPRWKSQFSCDRIAEEDDEEGPEEDKARRTFLQSLESLRRCTRGRQ